jgi:VCBS repeat protein
MKKAWWMVAVLAAAAPSLRAQQFQQVGTGLPGPVVWSEGVDVFDANGDGWLDIIFANGIGFSGASGALAPTLLINHTPSIGGTITFADETAARLPAGFVQQAKGVIAVDVDGDGDKDLVFANAFNSQPTVLINNGAGVFTNETAARFPAILLNSFGAGWGDVDNDGDIDLVFADAGPSAFGAPGGMAKLFRNDGTGHFTNVPVFTNLANKVGAQNAQLVDVDGDLDLDLIIDGKSVGQKLYLNDGQGHFLYYPTTLPAGTTETYATGWADLDNDNDIDGAYISLAPGFLEGTAQNNLIPSGTLSFTGSTATIGGLNGQDDNDVVFLDANNDGILDLIVGSLTNNKEKLYLNNGTFTPGSFVYQANGFTTITDSTLDLAVGDFDNDGDYDVVTAQGESGNFTNRVYRNTFFADTVPPRIGRVEDTPARVPLSRLREGLPRRAWIQDATYRRGETFVKASLQVAATKDGARDDFSVPMTEVGGGIHRGVIRPAPSPTGTVGMDVTFSVHATDPAGNAADSAPVTFRVCGAESYDAAGDGAAKASALNDPSLSANDFRVAISGLPPGRPGALVVGTAKVLPGKGYGGGRLVIGGSFGSLPPVFADDAGRAVVDLDFTRPPLAGVRAGETRYLQFLYRDHAPGTFKLSDALEVAFCD